MYYFYYTVVASGNTDEQNYRSDFTDHFVRFIISI